MSIVSTSDLLAILAANSLNLDIRTAALNELRKRLIPETEPDAAAKDTGTLPHILTTLRKYRGLSIDTSVAREAHTMISAMEAGSSDSWCSDFASTAIDNSKSAKQPIKSNEEINIEIIRAIFPDAVFRDNMGGVLHSFAASYEIFLEMGAGAVRHYLGSGHTMEDAAERAVKHIRKRAATSPNDDK